MNGDAAGPELHGEVSPRTTGGVIRYRTWPAKRHPARLVVAVGAVAVGTAGVGTLLGSAFWGAMAFLGLSLLAAAFFFPTLVSLDGPVLVVRQLGTPRSFDLREFRRFEVTRDRVARVELLRARGVPLASMEALGGLMLPLPEDAGNAERVLTHLNRWVGRTRTGRFVIDVDHAPDDDLEPTE
jgi:hypothetical protein